MAEIFDDITRIVGSQIPRRRALTLIGSALAGGVLGTLWPTRAWAACKQRCSDSSECADAGCGPCCPGDTANSRCCDPGMSCNSQGKCEKKVCNKPGETVCGMANADSGNFSAKECCAPEDCCSGKCCKPGECDQQTGRCNPSRKKPLESTLASVS